MITAEYPPLILGGVGAFVHDLTLELLKRDIQVTVVTRGRGFDDGTREGVIKIHRFYSPPIPPKDVWFYSTNSSRFGRVVEQVKPNIIHDASSAAEFLPWLTKKRNVVTTIHGSPRLTEIRSRTGCSEDHVRNVLFNMTHSMPVTFLRKLMKPDIKVYVHVSRFCLKDTIGRIKDSALREEYLEKTRVIYNGVNVRKLAGLKKEVLSENGQDPLAVTFIGRLMEYKGIRHLLRAFGKVVKEIEDAKLHIVGGGPLYKDTKAFIHGQGLARNIALHGALPRMDALSVLARSAFLVHPSFYESFGMVIAEAYALGKPVITHKAGYADEMVERIGAGLTVDVTDQDAFANTIETLLTDTNLRRRLSTNAQAAAREIFNIEVVAKKYEDLFRELST